ncbi:MAG: peptidoglycan D,D-transpeptidase FtsI family protein [Pontiellaceae bacterium]
MEKLVQRSWILEILIILLFGGIFFRLTLLHLRPESWITKPIEKSRSLEFRPVGSRGKILDRNGQILAADVAAYHVVLDPKYIAEHGDAVRIIEILSSVFKIDREKVAATLADKNRRYVRLVKYVPARNLESFDRVFQGVIYRPNKEAEVVLKGVLLEEAPIRSYPKGSLMAHVLGFSNREGVGSAGIELRYDAYLKGKEGHRSSKKDGRGREVYSARELDIPSENGATVVLTLDQQIQYVTEKAIEKICFDYNAKGAWAIVQDVRSGEILSMASFPKFDPNRYGRAPKEWLRNRSISVNFEPGSTMKAGVVSKAIDIDLITPKDRFDCENGSWAYAGKKLNDSHAEGVLSVEDILKVSSNIGTAKIALMMGDQRLYDGLKAFQFGERLGVGLPGEESGIFHSTNDWSKISATRIGMGQGISATSLQVLSMMSAIANDGFQMRPYLLKRVVSDQGDVLHESEPELLGQPISRSTALQMQRMLARVVSEEDGTGIKARVDGYTVGGKTGTAQKVKPREEGGGYYDKRFTSSFVGFIPVENPQLAIIVVADDPGIYTESGRKISYYGGTVCGPAFRDIAEFSVRYLRISPEGRTIYINRFE